MGLVGVEIQLAQAQECRPSSPVEMHQKTWRAWTDALLRSTAPCLQKPRGQDSVWSRSMQCRLAVQTVCRSRAPLLLPVTGPLGSLQASEVQRATKTHASG